MRHIRLPLLFASALFVANLHSAVIRQSQIVGYSTGNLGNDSGTGTLDGWANSTAQVTVTNGSGSLDGTSLGLVASAGDRVFISSSNTLSARNQFVTNTVLPQTTETNVYYSFLYRFIDASQLSSAGTNLLFRVNRANSGTGTAQHWDMVARNVAGQIQLGISKAGAPNNATNWATTNLNSGQTFFVVVRQHIITGAQNDIYDLWINPPSQSFGTNEANVPPSAASIGALTTDGTEDPSPTGPGRFVVCSGASAQFDELRIAGTWAEATPPLGQCDVAGVTASPANVTQSAEISATFNVTAAGTSPTLQWQRSTDTGTTWQNISGANAAIYVTPNLSLADNGSQYRAIVSVACNSSSATSEVATVTLTAPVVSAAGLVLHDQFDDGLRDDPPVAISNSVWRTATSANLDAFNTPGVMVGTPLQGSSSLWLGYFTDNSTTNLPIHLAVGGTLRVTLPFTPNSFNSFTNNAGLRLGVFDYADGGIRLTNDSAAAGGSAGNGVNVRGYMLNLDFGTNFTVNSPLQLLARNFLSDVNLMGTVSDYQSLGSGPAGGGFTGAQAFQPGTQYTLVFSVTRTAVNTASVTASITGGGTNWTQSVTDTNYAYHRFDAFGIRPNSLETSADSFSFSEFKVEVLQSAVSVPPFRITSIQQLAADAIKLTWESVNGATYYVLSSDVLSPGNWVTNGSVVATGSSSTFTNTPIPGSVAQRFYRILAPPY